MPGRRWPLDEVTFGTNWLAEAEHGGFYQAVADGTYEKYGLEVTIMQGGPQAANQALLLAGKIQFYMAGQPARPFAAVRAGHPGDRRRGDLPEGPAGPHGPSRERARQASATSPSCRPSSSAKDLFATGFQWMKAAYPGFKDEQIKPYTFNPAPFLADKNSVQQGYVTSEPFAIEKEGGFKPTVFLLADAGFDTYSTMIEAMADYVDKQPGRRASASSMPRSSAGTTTSTATTRPPTT